MNFRGKPLKIQSLYFQVYPGSKTFKRMVMEMKREFFMPPKHSCVCADLFTEDSFEQNLTVRSLLGLSGEQSQLNDEAIG